MLEFRWDLMPSDVNRISFTNLKGEIGGDWVSLWLVSAKLDAVGSRAKYHNFQVLFPPSSESLATW